MSDDGAAASGLHPLDNFVWGALNGLHRRFSVGGDRARRYLTEVAPFAAVADLGAESTAALRELVAAHGPAAMSTVDALPELPGLLPVSQVRLIQMVWQGQTVPAQGSAHGRLRERDVPAMMALALETRPGPFAQRTSELGEYRGIFDENKLVAMAGERMKVEGYTEISAVCVREGFRGRGYAAQLTMALVSAVRSRDETPLLHVLVSNHRAIALYRSLGFVERREMYLTVLDAVHDPTYMAYAGKSPASS
jgi:predicted GNAT family acetyltransferase